jgi:outer membrane protein OmpA-like peptidoglycan-associated protein
MSSFVFAQTKSKTPVITGLLQRQCACGKHTIAGGACAECARASEGIVRRNALDRQAPGIAPPIVHQALRSPGHPVDAATRAIMEPHLGRDLSHVLVHTGAEAAQSAAAVNASAYTVGRDIVFAEGRYAPTTGSGARLIAHELAHTIQQSGAPARPEHLTVGEPNDPAEREADRAADMVATSRAVVPPSGAAGVLRRQMPPAGGATAPASDALIENASPFLAAAVGSTTLDKFATGQADLTPAHQAELTRTAHHILVLLRKYANSKVSVTGFADTVGTEADNLTLGMSRAIAVKKALVDLKVPDSIISIDSKGEGAPQAVKTRDAVANASNRRVEVRFRPEAAPVIPGIPTTLPATPPAASAAKRPIDLTYHPKIDFDDQTKPPYRPPQKDYFKPIPPLGRSPSKSVADKIFKVIDPVIDRVVKILPESLRDDAKKAIHKGIITGSAKAARAAAEGFGVKDPAGLDALENAAKGLIQAEPSGGNEP